MERPKVGLAIIVKKGNKVLMGKRKGSHGEGTWNFPGGHLEMYEGLEECAKREVAEETSLRIKNLELIATINQPNKFEERHYVNLFFTADFASGEPQIMEPEKSEEWQWFEWGNLPKPIFYENFPREELNPFK